MDERTQGALLLAVGGIAIRLGVTDAALAYVKPAAQPLLLISGVLLVIIGIATVVRAFRGRPDNLDMHGHADDGHGHHPGHGPAVAWLLVLPLLALLLIAPPPLGAFAANRQSSRPLPQERSNFGELPEADAQGVIPMKVSEYVFRALYDESQELKGKTVRLSGFVTKSDDPAAAFRLTRFMLACCAADGQAVHVRVQSDQPAPAEDTWLELTGTWVETPGHEAGDLTLESPNIKATSFKEIEQPAQPYE